MARPRVHRATMPLAAVLAVGIATASGAAASDDAIAEELRTIDRVGERMAVQLADAPEDRHDAIREAFVYMVDKRTRELERAAGVSADEAEAFRADAKAIGHEHGLID